MAELRGLGAINDGLQQAGVRVLAVSVDTPAESARVVKRNELPFPILSDAEHRVIRDYGLVHRGGGPGGGDIAIPAHVLVDHDGTILWRRISHRIQDRPSPDEVLAAVKR